MKLPPAIATDRLAKRVPVLLFAFALLFCFVAGAGASSVARTNALAPNVGIEGHVTVLLPRADYRPRPLDDRTELILRVDSITALTNGQHRYALHYIGLEPGAY